jgi:hypothetical protein
MPGEHAADIALADTFALTNFEHRSRAPETRWSNQRRARAAAFRIAESIRAAELRFRPASPDN